MRRVSARRIRRFVVRAFTRRMRPVGMLARVTQQHGGGAWRPDPRQTATGDARPRVDDRGRAMENESSNPVFGLIVTILGTPIALAVAGYFLLGAIGDGDVVSIVLLGLAALAVVVGGVVGIVHQARAVRYDRRRARRDMGSSPH